MLLYYLVAIIGVAGITWLAAKKVTIKWYEWLIGIVGYLLLLVALQNWGASFNEAEPRAAWILLLIFGLPAVILLVVAWLLPTSRARKSG
jgi:uncharacterized membrane protein